MKPALLIYLLLLGPAIFARNHFTDSLRHELTRTNQGANRVLIMAQLSGAYRMMSPDSSLFYGQNALVLARKIHFVPGEVRALLALCFSFREKGNLSKAMELTLTALQKAKSNHLTLETGTALHYIGLIYADLNDLPKALTYFRLGLSQFNVIHSRIMISVSQMVIGQVYYRLDQLDSASYYVNLAHAGSSPLKQADFHSFVLFDLGDIQARLGHTQLALAYYQQSIRAATALNNYRAISIPNYRVAELFKSINQPDSSIHYARKALTNAQKGPFNKEILAASTLLASLYEPIDALQALQYTKIASQAKDNLFGTDKIQTIQKLLFTEQERQRNIELAKVAYQNRVRQYTLLTGLGLFLLIASILYRNVQQKRKANTLLQQKNEEIQRTLAELKATQTQLIQREKMASLGELTAGIAHEIQNPLNFVNNFSEVSTELVTELKAELDRGDTEEAKAIADDLAQNLQKITQHGGRASSIVKGMLEHSRISTGQKEPTNLNALADEYLHLACQGWQAKNKTFNATLVMDFAPNLTPVEVVPQEIGRVLLNLFNNAFYAVQQKQKTAPADYQPTVTVSTRLIPSSPERAQSVTQSTGLGLGNGVGRVIEIRVSDNGTGILESVKTKIFQPFFTTKPTGEGTGLGLSLSYDIITKGHGGTLTVGSVEGEETTFTISLPA